MSHRYNKFTRLIVDKASGNGIQVDHASPGWGWKDLLGQLVARGTGSNDPAFGQINSTNFWGHSWSATVMQQVWTQFHWTHDYAPGTDFYIHTHWFPQAASPNTGFVVWGFEMSFAKGYDQAAHHLATPIVVKVKQQSSATQYMHQIAEVRASASGGLISPATVNVSITSGTPDLTAASALFTATDIGRTVRIIGAGTAGGNLDTTIGAYVSTTAVTLAANASTTVTAQDAFRYRVFDSANLETDGVLRVRVYRDAANADDTCTDAVVSDLADIHFQSTQMGTKARNGPNFWT